MYEVMCFLVPTLARASGLLNQPAQSWLDFWHVWLSVNGCLAIGFSAWFIIGGLRDLGRFFDHLGRVTRDHGDDGTVPGDASGGVVKHTGDGSGAAAAAEREEQSGLLYT